MMPSWYLEKPLGDYVAIYTGKSGRKIATEGAAGGGAITSFLCYLLDNGIIDGVVAARKSKGLEGEIVVARTRDDIIKSAGSRWQVLPFTLKLKETIENESLRSMAIVGLPCQINFLRQMKTFPLLETDFSNKISMLISLFCFGTFAQESVLSYVREKYGIEPSSIEEIKISQKALKFIGDKEVEIKFDEITKYMQVGCLLCPDYTGIASDISAGTVEDKTFIIVRNNEANEMLKDANKKGYIEIENVNEIEIERVEKKATEKIKRASSYIAQLL
ncbi:MAG: Coenzyme F420 hydrogenase/dehydrogenase, beta subunit C-terminal domain [Thermoplasmata archaeon]|nr:Coenzyme F420 hydrogenase/dehydrogenase, beta subunit C-terminal domain [Thermoplasmata archaeon]